MFVSSILRVPFSVAFHRDYEYLCYFPNQIGITDPVLPEVKYESPHEQKKIKS